jgi:hypothetical protein
MTEGRQPFTAEIKTLAKGPSTYDPLENGIDRGLRKPGSALTELGEEERRGLACESGRKGLSGRPHRLDHWLHPEDGDHPLEIVGENVKAHLSSYLFERARQKVSRAHPPLDGPKRMFCGLVADTHGLGRAVQPLLHRVEDGFVLPTFDAPYRRKRALEFRSTTGTFVEKSRCRNRARILGFEQNS